MVIVTRGLNQDLKLEAASLRSAATKVRSHIVGWDQRARTRRCSGKDRGGPAQAHHIASRKWWACAAPPHNPWRYDPGPRGPLVPPYGYWHQPWTKVHERRRIAGMRPRVELQVRRPVAGFRRIVRRRFIAFVLIPEQSLRGAERSTASLQLRSQPLARRSGRTSALPYPPSSAGASVLLYKIH
jgi:hypothetical protein